MPDMERPGDAKEKARAAVKNATVAAGVVGGAAGALPVPFVDVAVVTPIQITMINAIAAAYDLPECERAAVVPMSLFIGVGTAKVSRAAAEKATEGALRAFAKVLAGKSVKFVPLVGTLIGAGVSAAVATGATKSLGEAWIRVCEYAARNELKELDQFLESDQGKLLIAMLTAYGFKELLDTVVKDAGLKRKVAEFEAENRDLRDKVASLEQHNAEITKSGLNLIETAEAAVDHLQNENHRLRKVAEEAVEAAEKITEEAVELVKQADKKATRKLRTDKVIDAAAAGAATEGAKDLIDRIFELFDKQ